MFCIGLYKCYNVQFQDPHITRLYKSAYEDRVNFGKRLLREATFLERMSGNKIEIQFAHVPRQLSPGKLNLGKILKAGIADRIGALDAWMTLKSRRFHCDWSFLRFWPHRAGRRSFSMLCEESFCAETQSLRKDPCWKCQTPDNIFLVAFYE